MMSNNDDGKLQPLKKPRSVKLVTYSMDVGVSQEIKSTTARKTKLSALMPIRDEDPKPSFEHKVSRDSLLGQTPLPKLSPYVSPWDQVPKSSSEKAFNTLSPYVSTWDQTPKSVSENEIARQPCLGQITLPVESGSFDFHVQDADTYTPVTAKRSTSHVLSSTKAESDPSEDELEMADSNAKETCAAGLVFKPRTESNSYSTPVMTSYYPNSN